MKTADRRFHLDPEKNAEGLATRMMVVANDDGVVVSVAQSTPGGGALSGLTFALTARQARTLASYLVAAATVARS